MHQKIVHGVIFLLASLNIVQLDGANILVLTFFSTKSHKITYTPLIEELAKRGHNITFVTPLKGSPHPNITEINGVQFDGFMNLNMFEKKEKGGHNQFHPFQMLEMILPICRQNHELPQIKNLLNQHFDLVFMQPFFNECALGLVYLLKAPLVLFSPVTAPAFLASKVGNRMPPSFVPHIVSGFKDEMTFLERMINMYYVTVADAMMEFIYLQRQEDLYKEILGNDIPSASEILGNASLILSNGHFSLQKPKPFLPNVIDVGGLHSRPAKPLPKDLEDFISAAGEHGFIYFSMGSALKSDKMSAEKKQTFLQVFGKLKQHVLWKWDGDESTSDLPRNVKLSNWFPQQDLLGHSQIKLFITHCGGGSLEESIFHGVPLLGIPMFGDQEFNGRQAREMGFMVGLDWNNVTESSLLGAINEVLNNAMYKKNVEKISTLFRDQIDKPLDRAVWWVEYVIRHNGAPQLKSVSRNLNFIQYHSLDVIAAYFLILSVIIYSIYFLLRTCIKFCCKTKKVPISKRKYKTL